MIRDYVRMIQRLLHRQMDQISFRTRHLNSSSSNSLNSNADRRKPPFDIHLNWTHYLLNKTTHTHTHKPQPNSMQKEIRKRIISINNIYIYIRFSFVFIAVHIYMEFISTNVRKLTHTKPIYSI